MSDYVTLEDLKASLELTGLEYADNDIRDAITAASRGIDEYCGRVFYSGGTADVYYYTPYDGCSVVIDDLVAVVAVDSDYDGNGTYETSWTRNTDYVLEPANAPQYGKPWETLRVLPNGNRLLTAWPNSLRITGQFGWSSVPAPVKSATKIQAARIVRRMRDSPFGVVGIGIDNVSARIPTVDPDVSFLLKPYLKGGGVLAA